MWDIIAVTVRASSDGPNLEDRIKEVNAYLYGRSFLLETRETEHPVMPNAWDLFYLVESHYTPMIIPRLASGLLWSRRGSGDDYARLIGAGVTV